MARLTGGEPRHWHDRTGRHRMADPRPFAKTHGLDPDEKRYATHLDRHDELNAFPERQENDGPAVLALFDHIEHMESIIAKERLLIVALRQQASRTPDDERAAEDDRVIRTLKDAGINIPGYDEKGM